MKHFVTVLELASAVLMTYGTWLFSPRASYLVAGVLVAGFAYAIEQES